MNATTQINHQNVTLGNFFLHVSCFTYLAKCKKMFPMHLQVVHVAFDNDCRNEIRFSEAKFQHVGFKSFHSLHVSVFFVNYSGKIIGVV